MADNLVQDGNNAAAAGNEDNNAAAAGDFLALIPHFPYLTHPEMPYWELREHILTLGPDGRQVYPLTDSVLLVYFLGCHIRNEPQPSRLLKTLTTVEFLASTPKMLLESHGDLNAPQNAIYILTDQARVGTRGTGDQPKRVVQFRSDGGREDKGYWKGNGSRVEVRFTALNYLPLHHQAQVVGFKKDFTFFDSSNKRKTSKRTRWRMTEYVYHKEKLLPRLTTMLQETVLCKIWQDPPPQNAPPAGPDNGANDDNNNDPPADGQDPPQDPNIQADANLQQEANLPSAPNPTVEGSSNNVEPEDLGLDMEIDANALGVNDLAFLHPNKQLCVVTCGDDKTIKVWDAANGAKQYTFQGHEAPVFYKENIQFIFSTALDGNIKEVLYDTLGSRVDYDAFGYWCTTMAYSADGSRLFSCGTSKEGESYIVEWNESEGAVKRTYQGFRKRSAGVVQFDTTNNHFLAAGDEFVIEIWDMDNINLFTTMDAEGGQPISRLIYTNTGTAILALASNAVHFLWERHSGQRDFPAGYLLRLGQGSLNKQGY